MPESITATPMPGAVEAHRVLNGAGANRHRDAVQMRHDRAILVDALDLGAPGQLAKRGIRQIDDSAINELEPATKDAAEPAAVGRVGPRLEDDNDARGAGRLIGPCAQRFVELVRRARAGRDRRDRVSPRSSWRVPERRPAGWLSPTGASSLSKT